MISSEQAHDILARAARGIVPAHAQIEDLIAYITALEHALDECTSSLTKPFIITKPADIDRFPKPWDTDKPIDAHGPMPWERTP